MSATTELPTKEANLLKGHEGAVLAARFNGDGNYALTCGKDRTIRLWNPHRGILIKTYKSHGREIGDVHVTSYNAKFCSCGGGRQVYYWDVWTLLTMRGKLKGTEWDPETSHRINFSDFMKLLDSNCVQYMEYSNYGQTISVILPYCKDEEPLGEEEDTKREIIQFWIECQFVGLNDVLTKLHQQIANVEVFNVDVVPAEVYTTVATFVVWSMRLALFVSLYVWIDNITRPIYAKLLHHKY
ncbi:WD40 repeat protein [Raphanus sativus]|nr:WD40 repeat protein [Raphanus sativus]